MNSIETEDTKVFLRQNSRTSYDKDEIFKVVGGVVNAIRLGLCTPYDKAIEEWLYEDPARIEAYNNLIREKYGITQELKNHTKPWLAVKRKVK